MGARSRCSAPASRDTRAIRERSRRARSIDGLARSSARSKITPTCSFCRNSWRAELSRDASGSSLDGGKIMIPAWLSFFDAILAIVLATVGVLAAHFYYLAPFQGFQLFVFGFVISLVGFVAGLIGIAMTRAPALAVARPRAVFGTM